MNTWEAVGSIASALTFLVTAIGVPIALLTWRKATRQRKTEFLAKYFTEYRSPEMGRAIARLWDLYRQCGEDRQELIEAYVKLNRNKGKELHFDVRRKVSNFFQQMGFLAREDPELRDFLFQIWTQGDLALIRDIILPLELFGVPRVIDPHAAYPSEELLIDNGRIVVKSAWALAHRVQADLFNMSIDHDQKLQRRHRRRDSP